MKLFIFHFMQPTPNLTSEQQQEVIRYQQIQQSLEILLQQKSTLEARMNESELAMKELEKVDDKTVVYHSIGGLMIKKNRTELLESTKDRFETISIRVKSLGEQEQRLKQQFEEQKKKVQQLMGAPSA